MFYLWYDILDFVDGILLIDSSLVKMQEITSELLGYA